MTQGIKLQNLTLENTHTLKAMPRLHHENRHMATAILKIQPKSFANTPKTLASISL